MANNKDLLQEVANSGAELGRATIFFHEAVARKFNLNLTDMKCMRFILLSQRPLIAGDLAEYTNLTTGAITGILDRLERQKMIKRYRDKNDKRRVLVEPEKDMAKRLASVFSPFSSKVSGVIQSFSEEQLETILKYKKLITELMDKETIRINSSEN